VTAGLLAQEAWHAGWESLSGDGQEAGAVLEVFYCDGAQIRS